MLKNFNRKNFPFKFLTNCWKYGNIWILSIRSKLQFSLSKLGQMVRKFPGKVSAKSENYQLPKFEPLDLKFREQHHMKRKFKVKKSKYKKLGTNFAPRQCRWKTFIWRNNAFSFAGTFTFGKKGVNYCVWLEQESLLMKSYQCSAHSYDGLIYQACSAKIKFFIFNSYLARFWRRVLKIYIPSAISHLFCPIGREDEKVRDRSRKPSWFRQCSNQPAEKPVRFENLL